ncbi:MAG TPA: UpxY family transcription antiterminator [Chitinophagaceae bacterium]|nr:UpxY family transcription antiterminator [Chitinophagaceae bacterium]
MVEDLHWYAVYTKPCWEKKVARTMAEKGIEHYCPLQKVIRKWSDRKKTLLEPLFKSYVFVRIARQSAYRAKEVDGVLHFVHFLGKPAMIADHEIDSIKRFLDIHHHIKIDKCAVQVNDNVRINAGPFMNMRGTVLDVNHKTLRVYISSLGLALTADPLNVDCIHQPLAANG